MGSRLNGVTVKEKLHLNNRVEGDCWRWTGAHTPKGYGQLQVNGRRHAVHRLAYEHWIGPIPEGLEIDHLCQVRDCINPSHLEAVTHAENVRRTVERRAHCKQGHEFTPSNTRWVFKKGRQRASRACRTCIRAWKVAARARAREERCDA